MEPNPGPVARRLAAILAADAANFSGLVAEDEERTLRMLARHRVIIDRTIAAHEGRIVTTAGDSVLAEFASPVQAVRAAIAIQRSLADVATRSEGGRPMRFRIGINVGDVVVDGDNLLGDGVNVAVRLETIAQPGAILISASVRDHIAGKIAAVMEDLGNQFLKNIPKPVRAYRVVFDDEESRILADRARRLGARSYAAIAAIAVVALGLGWWKSQTAAPTKASADPGTALGSATDDERTYWQVVSQSRDPDELKAFLRRYPQSTFAEIAQARLNGLLAGRAQHAESAELVQKSAEAAKAQAEAARLKGEADAAIARAATEQASAMRLKAEAELAAVRAAAASKAVVDAQQRLARPGGASISADEQIVLVRSTSPYDGRWTADWNCEASADQPSSTLKLPVLIQYREIRIEQGQVGLPGYFRAYGRIAEDGSFDLKGTSLPKTQRILGSEQSMAASGRGEMDKFEGHGSIGTRRCAVLIARGSIQ